MRLLVQSHNCDKSIGHDMIGKAQVCPECNEDMILVIEGAEDHDSPVKILWGCGYCTETKAVTLLETS
jgi:hypothetical protein